MVLISFEPIKFYNMRKILYLMFAVFVLVACSSDNDDMMMNELNNEGNSDEITPELIKGNFVSDSHPTTGMVRINEDKSVLSLNNFKTDDGPKLLLYLSKEVDSKEYVDLVDLKGIEGKFEYEIPANSDLNKFKYVVVWCVDFSVSFDHAELE